MKSILQYVLYFVLGVLFASQGTLKEHMLHFLNRNDPPSRSFVSENEVPPAPPSLQEFSDQIKVRDVHEICPGVYQARGFALANSIMIEGSDGVVIVDTTESLDAAREIMAEFRKITSKPVAAIVYTHFHADHITGTSAFVEDPANPPPIYSHEDTIRQITQFLSTPDLVMQRAFRQFGVFVPPKWHKGSGIGPFLRSDMDKGRKEGTAPMLPTVTFQKELTVTLAGDLEMKLIHSPGETDDQIIVWLPQRKILIPADNLYRTFPNLYAIRGNPARDANKWVASVDLMRSLEPEILVPCHLNAIVGWGEIQRILTAYRDGIHFVLDQTLRLMNKGLHPDDLQYMIQLPPKLKENPYLFEHYGTLRWSIRGIFSLYMGWFSGYAEDLMPLPRRTKATHYIELMGGAAKVLEAAKSVMAMEEAEFKETGHNSGFNSQLALELSSMILAAEEKDENMTAHAKDARVTALKALAAKETSANGRNYYLTQALEMSGLQLRMNKADAIRSAPMKSIISLMPYNVDPKKAEGVKGTLVLHFVDTEEKYVLTIRNCIVLQRSMDATPLPSNAVTLKVAEPLWREILIGEKSAAFALARGQIEIEGGSIAQTVSMLGIFES